MDWFASCGLLPSGSSGAAYGVADAFISASMALISASMALMLLKSWCCFWKSSGSVHICCKMQDDDSTLREENHAINQSSRHQSIPFHGGKVVSMYFIMCSTTFEKVRLRICQTLWLETGTAKQIPSAASLGLQPKNWESAFSLSLINIPIFLWYQKTKTNIFEGKWTNKFWVDHFEPYPLVQMGSLPGEPPFTSWLGTEPRHAEPSLGTKLGRDEASMHWKIHSNQPRRQVVRSDVLQLWSILSTKTGDIAKNIYSSWRYVGVTQGLNFWTPDANTLVDHQTFLDGKWVQFRQGYTEELASIMSGSPFVNLAERGVFCRHFFPVFPKRNKMVLLYQTYSKWCCSYPKNSCRVKSF